MSIIRVGLMTMFLVAFFLLGVLVANGHEPSPFIRLQADNLDYTVKVAKIESVGAPQNSAKAGEAETYSLTVEISHLAQDAETGAIKPVSQFYALRFGAKAQRDAVMQQVQQALGQ